MSILLQYVNYLIAKWSVTFLHFILPLIIVFLVLLGTFLLFTNLFCLPTAYIAWAVYSDPLQFVPHNYRKLLIQKHNLWKIFASYFPVKMHMVDSTMFNETHDCNYLLLHHSFGPQNVPIKLAVATNALNWLNRTENFKNYMAVNPTFFKIPGFRDLAFALGFVSDSPKTFRNMFAEPNANRIVTVSLRSHSSSAISGKFDLKRHTEMFRIALKYGVSLVPVLCLGEHELFKRIRLSKFFNPQSFLPKSIYYGCGFFFPYGILPFRSPIRIIIGRAIKVEKTDQYDNKEIIDELINHYTEQLNNLYEQET